MAIDFSKYGTPVDSKPVDLSPDQAASVSQSLGSSLDFSKYGTPATQGATNTSTTTNTTEPNYFQRVAGDYSKAAQDIKTGVQKGAAQYTAGVEQANNASNTGEAVKGELTATGGLLRAGLRTAGGVASAAFSPIIEAPIIKQTLSGIGSLISKIPGVSDIVQNANELAKQHPELAKDIQNVVDIVTVGAGSSVEKPAQSILKKGGASLAKSGEVAAQASKDSFAKKLVMPVETKAIKESQVPRTVEQGGLFKKDVVTPTASEARSIEAVSKIDGISPKNTYQKNFNIIRDVNVQKAQKLEADIATNDFAIPRKETLSRLQSAANDLEQSPLLVGDAQKTAERMLAKARQLVDQNPGTGSGLLKARKEFDAWVQEQKPKIFDANAENALTTANRSIRDTFNTLLDEKAPSIGVRNSLQEQSALYRAMENIQVKAAQEANTVFGRSLQSIGKALGTRNKLVQTLAAATGIGVFGAATAYALPLTLGTAAGWLLYKGGKLVIKPEIRKGVGELLTKYGEQIAPADRAILQGLLQEFSDSASSE